MNIITFVTAWYNLKSKFNVEKYKGWLTNFLSNVNHFNLVIYTNKESLYLIKPFLNNKNIICVIKELEEFHCAKYNWLSNHNKNNLLNNKIGWELNMLWNEKINFVKETVDNKYFDTNWYGWCDIGYFRSKEFDVSKWPCYDKISNLSIHHIYYCKVSKNINNLVRNILITNDYDLPENPIPPNQVSIAGGFFLCHKSKIDWWHEVYYTRLDLYFKHNYLVKDDQIIIIDCIVKNLKNFHLVHEKTNRDPWFVFQTFLYKYKISILMPIYNGIDFLEESLQSVKNQTYTNWELIIGINGHQPNSEVYNLAKNYESDKIKVYDLIEVKGKSNSLNKMLPYSCGEIIALLDVDDIWLPSKLSKQIPYIYEYDVVGTMCKYFGDRSDQPMIPLGDLKNHNFINVNPIINSSCLIRKSLAYWNTEWDGVEDYDLWLKLWKQGKQFYNVESIQVMHRIHQESAFNAKGNHLKVNELKTKYI